MNEQVQDWPSRGEKFRRQEAQIRQILAKADKPLHIGEIAERFISYFRYLPSDLCRRMRVVVASGDVVRNDGAIPTYELVRSKE